eukprot:c19725_g1_i1 orf=173-1201(+)
MAATQPVLASCFMRPFRPLHSPSTSRSMSVESTRCSIAHIASHTVGGLYASIPLAAVDAASSASDGFGVDFAVAGGGFIAVLAAVLSVTDPETRRRRQAAIVGGDDKEVVRNYFNAGGFERWKRIYGETEDLNNVQLDIRKGHAQTVEKVLGFLREGGLEGVSVCDAGCGTGSLAIPLALEGAVVSASDISFAMVAEAERQAEETIGRAAVSSSLRKKQISPPRFEAKDLESLSGKYHTVACIDVLIHYPQEKAAHMISHLASLAENRLLLSFAPKTYFSVLLKRIGELFPGPSKATRAYLHAEQDVEAALKAVGWVVRRRDMTSTKFYYSRLLEAVPAGTQ